MAINKRQKKEGHKNITEEDHKRGPKKWGKKLKIEFKNRLPEK